SPLGSPLGGISLIQFLVSMGVSSVRYTLASADLSPADADAVGRDQTAKCAIPPTTVPRTVTTTITAPAMSQRRVVRRRAMAFERFSRRLFDVRVRAVGTGVGAGVGTGMGCVALDSLRASIRSNSSTTASAEAGRRLGFLLRSCMMSFASAFG